MGVLQGCSLRYAFYWATCLLANERCTFFFFCRWSSNINLGVKGWSSLSAVEQVQFISPLPSSADCWRRCQYLKLQCYLCRWNLDLDMLGLNIIHCNSLSSRHVDAILLKPERWHGKLTFYSNMDFVFIGVLRKSSDMLYVYTILLICSQLVLKHQISVYLTQAWNLLSEVHSVSTHANSCNFGKFDIVL